MTNILSTRRLSGIFSLGSQSSAPDSCGDLKEVFVEKDSKGYGFQVFGEYPAHIAQVREGCPAQRGGLAVHDIVIKIDSENVSNMAHDQIVALIRQRQKFSMTVRKGSAALQRQHYYVPSSPIPISPQMDDIAKLGGYDVTCAMIAAECKRLLEFREQLEVDDLSDNEKSRLRNSLASSQQIIQNLQRKVPESYLDRIKEELNISSMSEFLQGDATSQNGENSNVGPLSPTKYGDENSASEGSTEGRRRAQLKRRASVSDRISRTHSIAQDVLSSFRTLRSQKVTTKNLLSQYGSLQNIVNKERQETLQENRRKLSRKNTISDSNLNQNMSDSESTTTLKVDTAVVPGSPCLSYPRSGKNSVDSSHSKTQFLHSAGLTTHYIREAFSYLCQERSIEAIEELVEALKEIFFLYFYGYVEKMYSNGKDRKEKDEFYRNCTSLIDMFIETSSETCLKFLMKVEAPKLSELAEEPEFVRLQNVRPFCLDSLDRRVGDLISRYPKWVLPTSAKSDIERDLNGCINQFEGIACTDAVLTERIKFDLCVCVVTFLKLNQKRYKGPKWGPVGRNNKCAYYNLFSKKNRSGSSVSAGNLLNSNKPVKQGKAGHLYQTFSPLHLPPSGFSETAATPPQRCEHCSTTVTGPAIFCILCNVVLHNCCGPNYSAVCSPSNGNNSPWHLNRSNTSAPLLGGLSPSPTSPSPDSQNPSLLNSNPHHSRSSTEVTASNLHSLRMIHTCYSANNSSATTDETDSVDSLVSSASANKNSSSNSFSISSSGTDPLLLPAVDVALQNISPENKPVLQTNMYQQGSVANSSAAAAANLKRTTSMKEETNATRNRKASYSAAKISPRNASDPVPHMVEAAAVHLQCRPGDNNSTSPSSSDMSSANSHTSLGASTILHSIDDKVKQKFKVCHYRDREFTASDDFATIDKVATKQVLKNLSKDQKKQQNVLLEFLNSERKQTFNLKLLCDVFDPILRPHSNNSTVLIPEITKLMDFHFTFYTKLLNRFTPDYVIREVGDVFIDMFENTDYRTKFAEYYKWSSSKSFQLNRVRKLEEENRGILEKRSLQDLMASEFQRATKYKLLVEALIKCSSEVSIEEKSNLDRALDVVTKLISQIDTDKGLQDYRLIAAKIDRSEIDREQSSSHGSNEKDIDMKMINLEEKKPLMYGNHFALLKFLSKQTKDIPHQLKQFKNYFVILFAEHLILVERDYSTDKMTWKTYLDQDKSLKTVILRKDILHVTSDSTRPLKDEKAELVKNQLLNFTCICTSLQLIVFVSTLEEKNKWMDLIKGSGVGGPGAQSRQSNMSKKTKLSPRNKGDIGCCSGQISEQVTSTDAANFNFEQKVSYVSSGISTSLKASGSSIGSSSLEECSAEMSPDERLAKIAHLRSQVIKILKESFDLARSVFDPDNILEPDKLSQAHQYVIDDQLLCLVDKDCWMKQFDSPLMSLPGQLGTSDTIEINDVNFYLDDGNEKDPKKTLCLEVSENDGGVSIAEVPGQLKIFADKSPEPNEVHLQRPALEDSMKIEQRLQQKLMVLDSQVEETYFEGNVDFDINCQTPESNTCKNERVPSSTQNESGSSQKYKPAGNSWTTFYSESVVLHHGIVNSGESTIDATTEEDDIEEKDEVEDVASSSYTSASNNSDLTSVSENNTVFLEVKVPSNEATEANTSAEIEDIDESKQLAEVKEPDRARSASGDETTGSCSTLKAENSTEFEQVQSLVSENVTNSGNDLKESNNEETSDFDDIVISHREC